MKFSKIIIVLFIAIITITFSACGKKNDVSSQNQENKNLSNTVEISFPYVKQKGTASNQFAVWIEDETGEYVKTLFVTKFTATKGYKSREDAIPTWVEKSKISEEKTKEIDSVTGATPKSGDMVYTWDLKDKDGKDAPKGTYNFYVEGTTRWQSRILYSGEIEIGGNKITVKAEPKYSTDEAKESDMIGEVNAVYNP